MADEFYLDSASLKHATGNLRGAGEDLFKALAELNGILDHNENCWGKDEIGQAFENKYVNPSTEVRAKSKANAELIVEAADVTDKNAAKFAGLDKESAERLDRTPPPPPA